MAENNDENRAKLADAVVDLWDMKQLLDFAIQQEITIYERDNEAFQEDWVTIFEAE